MKKKFSLLSILCPQERTPKPEGNYTNFTCPQFGHMVNKVLCISRATGVTNGYKGVCSKCSYAIGKSEFKPS